MQTFLTLLPYILTLTVIGAGYVYQQLPAKARQEVDLLHQRIETARGIVFDVVQKTEQTMYSAPGQTRKQSAMNAINAILAEMHLPISSVLIDAMLESIVSALPPTRTIVAPISQRNTQPVPIVPPDPSNTSNGTMKGAQPFTAQ